LKQTEHLYKYGAERILYSIGYAVIELRAATVGYRAFNFLIGLNCVPVRLNDETNRYVYALKRRRVRAPRDGELVPDIDTTCSSTKYT
jgi:hypothetical protein